MIDLNASVFDCSMPERLRDPSSGTEKAGHGCISFERGESSQIIGSLQWLSMQSRLDISFEVNQLQKRIPDLRVFDLLRANSLVKEVKNSGSVELVVENQGRECEIAFLGGLSSGLKAFWLPCLLASRLWLPSFWLEIELSLEALSVSWNPTEGKNKGRKEGGREGRKHEGRSPFTSYPILSQHVAT